MARWLPLFLSIAVVVALFYQLGGAALFEPDEGRNAEKAREILVLGDWITPHENFHPVLDKPIFFYWLIAIAYRLFGVSEWAARVPSGESRVAPNASSTSSRATPGPVNIVIPPKVCPGRVLTTSGIRPRRQPTHAWPASCQAVRAPESPDERLVPEDRAEALMMSARSARPGDDTEIRLTYRQLTALIEEAVRSLQ